MDYVYDGCGLPTMEEGCPEDLFFIVNFITDYFDSTAFLHTQVGVNNMTDNTSFTCSHCDMSQSYNFTLVRNNKGWDVQISPKNIPTLIKKVNIDNGLNMKEIRGKLKNVFKLFEPKVSMCRQPWKKHTIEQFYELHKK